MLSEITIKCFLSVAKHLSFTKSSEELFMSRQAVSKQILLMEERLGVKLFDRTTNQVGLTVEGSQYLAFFRSMVRDFEMLSEAVGKIGAPRERMVLGYLIGLLMDQRIVGVLGEYRRKKTATDLKIERFDVPEIERRLLEGQLEMAFTYIPLKEKRLKGFSHIVLEHAEYVLAASRNHPKVKEDTVLGDFDGERAVYWKLDDSDDAVCRKHFNAAWRNIGITVVPSRQCTFLSSAYSELLFGDVVMLCNSKHELCTFPAIVTYPLPKRENFGCVWSDGASQEVKELAGLFGKYEIKSL